MKIDLHEITIKELSDGYKDSGEDGVVGYGGKLNIRPAYQREFVYKDNQRDAVVESIIKNFPINVMYWVKNVDGTYEVLDGQQRTISVCQYINGDFSINSMFFENLTTTERKVILDYKAMVYFCEGNDKEKLDWFKIINIAGAKLTEQELRNAIYTGEWLYDAKKWFSKSNCPAARIAVIESDDYLTGVAIRQDYLETAIGWISARDDLSSIKDYMATHQHDHNASDLWVYFQNVINWVKVTFTDYRKEMKGLEWGILYNKYKDVRYDPAALELRIKKLIDDDDVQNKKGIYAFLLSKETDKTVLNLRAFDKKTIAKVYERQKGICPQCDANKHYTRDEMEADHIVPWSDGGKTTEDNCQMLCKNHNRKKSNK